VGSIRLFLKQFQAAAKQLPKRLKTPRRYIWVVGNAVEHAFQPIVQRLNQVKGLEVRMVAIASDYWGQTMTVTGLLTGQDILTALIGQDLGDGVLLPSVMLKHGDTRFLDDLTVEDLEQKLNTAIWPVDGVEGLVDACASGLQSG
jgi:putative radical SAM enzyme (TIGR03279 family)